MRPVKLCSACGRPGDFYKKPGNADGLTSKCTACYRLARRTYAATPSGQRTRGAYERSPARKAALKLRIQTNATARLGKNLRIRLHKAIRRNRVGSAVRDMGCTSAELRAHIERLWRPGMSWTNYGKGPGTWQIDHIRPLAGFDLAQREQLLQACHFSNLQPLWFADHVEKTTRELTATG